MRPNNQCLLDQWESLQEEYAEAKKDFDEAASELEKIRCEKEDFLTHVLFGI